MMRVILATKDVFLICTKSGVIVSVATRAKMKPESKSKPMPKPKPTPSTLFEILAI